MQTNFELKRHNTMKIFQAMRSRESVSRKELATLTGLSWGSVSAISAELLQKGIAVAEKEASAGGRPAERLALSPDKFLQLGIDINSVGLSFVVVNLQGKAVYSELLPIESRDKDDLLTLLYAQTERILLQTPSVIGINLSMQGKINKKTGVSLRTNFFKAWKDVPLVHSFERRFSIPTKLYHDPDCLLYYHMQNDPRLSGKNDGFVVRLDDGIGMSRLLGGRLYERGDDASYELGHTIAVPDGRACACGKRGCLEAYASLRGMREIYAEKSGEKAASFPEKLRTGDGLAQAVLREACDRLGVAIANLFTLSAPEFILLDGGLFAQAPYCFDEIEKNTRARLADDCNLLFAAYTREAPAIGACLITVEKTTEEILFGL
ncbi:MAG: ROK family protein [Clostridia bacterium]|nr:ROK family protein [Clostridia bacterium]